VEANEKGPRSPREGRAPWRMSHITLHLGVSPRELASILQALKALARFVQRSSSNEPIGAIGSAASAGAAAAAKPQPDPSCPGAKDFESIFVRQMLKGLERPLRRCRHHGLRG